MILWFSGFLTAIRRTITYDKVCVEMDLQKAPCSLGNAALEINHRITQSKTVPAQQLGEGSFLPFQPEVSISQNTCLFQGFLTHHLKAESEHPPNETAVAKFCMASSKVTSLLVLSVVPGNGLRSWHHTGLCCDTFQQVAGFFLTIFMYRSSISLGYEAS